MFVQPGQAAHVVQPVSIWEKSRIEETGPFCLYLYLRREPLGQRQKQNLPQWQVHFHKDKFVRTGESR